MKVRNLIKHWVIFLIFSFKFKVVDKIRGKHSLWNEEGELIVPPLLRVSTVSHWWSSLSALEARWQVRVITILLLVNLEQKKNKLSLFVFLHD